MNEGLVGLFGAARSGVKSVQQVTVTFPPAGATSATATINPVNVNKSVLIPLGATTYDDTTRGSVRLELTNSTTVTGRIAVSGSGLGPTVAGFQVVEFF